MASGGVLGSNPTATARKIPGIMGKSWSRGLTFWAIAATEFQKPAWVFHNVVWNFALRLTCAGSGTQ